MSAIPHLFWRHLSTSEIFQLLLTHCWLNFKNSFIWPFLPDGNRNFHPSFWIQVLNFNWKIFFVGKISYDQKYFLDQMFLDLYLFFDLNFLEYFRARYFFTKFFFLPKCLIFGSHLFNNIFFGLINFWQIWFGRYGLVWSFWGCINL